MPVREQVTEPPPVPVPAGLSAGSRTTALTRLRGFGRSPRIMGLDVARGLAVIGMVGAHVGLTQDLVWSDVSTWSGLVNGRPSIAFALVAGASIALLTGGPQPPRGERLRTERLRLVGRGMAIFAIGVVLELLGTGVAVILPLYGVLFVLAAVFVAWRRRTLLLVAAGLALLGPVVLAAVGALALNAFGPGLDLVLFGVYPVTVWAALVLAGVAIGRSHLQRARFAAGLLVVGAVLAVLGYGAGAGASALSWNKDAVGGSASSWSGPGSFLDSGSVSGSDSGTPVDVELGSTPGSEVDIEDLLCDVDPDGWVTCYPAEVAGQWEDDLAEGDFEDLSYWDQLVQSDPVPIAVAQVTSAGPHSGGIPEVVGSGGFALAVLGLCLLVARPLRWLLLPVAATGSMPLTAYAGHVVVIAVVGISGDGSGYWGPLVLGVVIGCTAWALLLGRGPLERLLGRAAGALARPARQPG